MIKYGIILGIFSTIASVLAFGITKEISIPIIMGCGLVSGLLLSLWFVHAKKIIPTAKEFKIITITYGLFMASVTILPVLAAKSPTLPGVLRLALYALVYPSFFSLLFNEKRISAQLKKDA